MSERQDRQVARRAYAAEFNDASYIFSESDDEMAPNFALLPTGVRMNRAFFVGTLTEKQDVGDDSEYWQARVVDPTGTFFVYAGQYQPEAASFIRDADTPQFVAVVGKPRSYETDDGDMNVTIRPEYIKTVKARTRTNWVIETAARTLDRIEEFEQTDLDSDMAPPDLQMAYDQYDPDMETYREAVEEAVYSVTE